MEKVLEVNNLNIGIYRKGMSCSVVNDLSFSINEGETLGIVGESGCGKTMTALSIMRLLPNNIEITSGNILFKDSDLLEKTDKEIRRICGKDIGMVFQEPMTSLNPLLTIEEQIGESLKYHLGYDRQQRRTRILELLGQVGISYPEKRIRQYPHEFSGGMRQRVMIAMALACNPKLIIADEPTTALDVTIQARILQLILNLQKKLGIAVIFITHNLGVVAKIADYVNVMYAGKVVETGKAEDIFFDPRHPYTWGLLSSMPDLTGDKKERLYTIPGNPPNLANEVKGDAFAVRNPYALNIDFEEEPPMFEINEHHQAATWLLHPDAPKVEMPQTLKKRIEQLRREEKRYAETEGAYGTDE